VGANENGLLQDGRTAKNLAALWPNISDVPLTAMYHFVVKSHSKSFKQPLFK